jgi:hypothetical protein
MKKYIWLILIIILLGCEETTKPDTASSSFSQLTYQNLEPLHQVPNKIQYFFSLRDENNHAVIIPESDYSGVNLTITEDSEPIDVVESNVLFYQADDFAMDLVLILDFSQSIKTAGSLDEMLDGAEEILNSLSSEHRVSVMEFHDHADNGISTIIDFTYNKEDAKNAITDFANQFDYFGFSSCWDAVNNGLEKFPLTPEYSKFRSLVFLSDGSDTSSEVLPADLLTLAEERKVHIYNIGYGEISDTNEEELLQLGENTGGAFYSAPTVETLDAAFEQIISDLSGNYILSYITSNYQSFTSEVSLELDNITMEPVIQEQIDIDAIAGNDRYGLFEIRKTTIRGVVTGELYCSFVPRNISKFRFQFIADQTPDISINEDFLSEWQLNYNDSDGYYELSGDTLAFGSDGVILNFSFEDQVDFGNVQIKVDNSIYSNGIMFYDGDETHLDDSGNWIGEIFWGLTINNPFPYYNSVLSDSLPRFNWSFFKDTADTNSVYFDLIITEQDSLPDTLAFAITDTFFVTTDPLKDSTNYEWNINYTYRDSIYLSKKWSFRTLFNLGD